MTSHTPAPGPDAPDGTPGPSPASAAGPPTSPEPGRVRPCRRYTAGLLASAVPLAAAAAALASAPAAIAAAATPPAASSTTRPSQALAAELLNGAALPSTTAGIAITDPKIPAASGD